MSNETVRNEAADHLLLAVSVLGHLLPQDVEARITEMRKWVARGPDGVDWDELRLTLEQRPPLEQEVENALAAERRATVHRLTPWLAHDRLVCDAVVCTCGLDEEAAR